MVFMAQQQQTDIGQTRTTRTGDGHATHEHRTAKVVELMGSSRQSFEDAIRNCLKDASETTRGITGCHVEGMSVKCENGEITEYKVNVKVAFGIERTMRP
jgi:dodecin